VNGGIGTSVRVPAGNGERPLSVQSETFARTRGNGRDAPVVVVPAPRLTAALVKRVQTELQLRLRYLAWWPIIKPQVNH